MIGGGRFGSVIWNRCGFRVEPQWLLNGDFLVVIGASGRPATQSVEILSEGAFSIQYGYIIEAAISYYPIRNGWKLWYRKNGLFYYKTIQDCRSYDLQNIGLKIHNFSLELKQSKTPPAASCWIISTLVRRYVFFNPRCCKSWGCPNLSLRCFRFCNPRLF